MTRLTEFSPDMIANNLNPYEPTHPGEMIKDEIAERGLSQRKLAQQMGVSYSVLNEVLNGKRPVTVEYALMLEAALGIDADLWIGMQAAYNKQMAQRDSQLQKRLDHIRRIAAML
ncbi:MAG: HigA family addiction module antidote protein [Prevotella sp.]|nr:HigA family addiction module antidote protein [Prevotella sp.]